MVQQMEHQNLNMKQRMDEIQSQFTYLEQVMESNTKKANGKL